MEGDTMTDVMTAEELAEFRAWLNRRAPYNPDDEEFLPVRVTSLHGLLATVDALTARIYELEDLLPSAIVTAERDTYAAQLAEFRARDERSLHALATTMADYGFMDDTWTEKDWDRFVDTIRLHMEPADGDALMSVKQRDERYAKAIEDKVKAEVERDAYFRDNRHVSRRLNEALALADARGRALDGLVEAVRARTRMYDHEPLTQAVFAAEDAIHTPAPEALRQQQEREAGKDALIERLRDWLERFGEHSDRCDVLLLDDQGRHQTCSCGFDAIAYGLTPPQALREREERVAALEAVAEAAKEYVWRNDVYCRLCEEECTCGALAFKSSLRALDAVKGGQP